MSYARPCKYCGIQVIWDDKLTSTNKFKELDTNEQHSQERCKAIQAGQLQQTPTTKPQQQQSGETAKTVWSVLEEYNKRIQKLEAKVFSSKEGTD